MRLGPQVVVLALALAADLACGHASPRVKALEPLCGTWSSGDGHVVTESWSRDRHGLRGHSSTGAPDGRVVAMETMTLTVGRSGTTYHAEPAGSAPTDFTEIHDPGVVPGPGERVWVWVNPGHDFPRRIVYRLAGESLTATVSNPDGDDAQRRGQTWVYERIEACPP